MAPLPPIRPPTYPTPAEVYPPTHTPGYAYQHTYLPTYTHSTTYPSTHTQWPVYPSNYTYPLPTHAHPTTYPSTCTPWHSNSLDSTSLPANPTHYPSILGCQYLDRRLLPPPSPKLSDAKTPAQVWEDQYQYEGIERFMHALSLIFEYWTSQNVYRRYIIMTLTSSSTIT